MFSAPYMPPANQYCDLVVIGASAGGLDALKGLLSALPPHLNVAVLIAMHLAPGRASMLAHILQGFTAMPISDAVDGQRLEHGHLYVAIADHQLTIERGCMRVLPTPKEGLYRPCIDTLFYSAAACYGTRVVGVVLSGLLRDGTAGLRHITAGGGVTVVQDPAEALESSMPQSAISGDHVQYCLPVREIAHLLTKLATPNPVNRYAMNSG